MRISSGAIIFPLCCRIAVAEQCSIVRQSYLTLRALCINSNLNPPTCNHSSLSHTAIVVRKGIA